MKCLAIIPARSGSKRIPNKNIRDFCGHPIIYYSITTALKSKCFSEVMVSTDDTTIAQISEKFGAHIPFLRTPQTSNDTATLADVIIEVLLDYQKKNIFYDYVCCILATAPFINESIIHKSFNLLLKQNAESLIPVTKYTKPIQRALKINNEKLEMILPQYYNTRSQDLEDSYYDCGLFYWIKPNVLFHEKKLITKHSIPFFIPEKANQDIDNEEDWIIAEQKYKIWINDNNE